MEAEACTVSLQVKERCQLRKAGEGMKGKQNVQYNGTRLRGCHIGWAAGWTIRGGAVPVSVSASG